MTSADVMWQDGSVECNIRSNDLFPVHHLDNNEFCPGDFVVDKRGSAKASAWSVGHSGQGQGSVEMGLGLEEYFLKVSLAGQGKPVIAGRPPRASQVVMSLLVFLVQSCPDPAVYGVVQSGDHVGRTCMVKWFKLRPTGDDVEVSLLACFFSGGGGSRERGEALAHASLVYATAHWRRGGCECL